MVSSSIWWVFGVEEDERHAKGVQGLVEGAWSRHSTCQHCVKLFPFCFSSRVVGFFSSFMSWLFAFVVEFLRFFDKLCGWMKVYLLDHLGKYLVWWLIEAILFLFFFLGLRWILLRIILLVMKQLHVVRILVLFISLEKSNLHYYYPLSHWIIYVKHHPHPNVAA